LHSHADVSSVDPWAHARVRVAVAAHPAHWAQLRPSPKYSDAHSHADTSRLELNGHVASCTPPVAAHPAQAAHVKPSPKYPALHAHDTLSTRVCRSQIPYVVAWASQLVHCPQVCVLTVITPANPWPHRHDPDFAAESLLAGQGVHSFGLSVAVNEPASHWTQVAELLAPSVVE
jgi:hypothetical protein